MSWSDADVLEARPGAIFGRRGSIGVIEGQKYGEEERESSPLGSVDIVSSSNGRVDGCDDNERQTKMNPTEISEPKQTGILETQYPNGIGMVPSGNKIQVSAPIVEDLVLLISSTTLRYRMNPNLQTETVLLEPTTVVDPDELNAVPITVIANRRSKLTMRHIHIEKEYDSNTIRQTKKYVEKYQDTLVVQHKVQDSTNVPSRFYRHLLEYIKSEKKIRRNYGHY